MYSASKKCYCYSVMSNSLWTHKLQHARLPCPFLSPRVCSNSCPLSRWCHPTISSFMTPFSSCPQCFLTSGFFPINQLFASGVGWSFIFSISPSNEYSGLISFRIDWFELCAVKGISRVYSSTTVWKHQLFSTQPSLWEETLTSVHDYEKTIALTIQTFVG